MLRKLSFGVVTVATDNIRPYAEVSRFINQKYCDRYDYTYHYHTTIHDTTRHAVWDKMPSLLKHWNEHDYLLWLDADAIVANQDLSLTNFIDDEHELFISKDINGLNSGVFIIKCTEMMRGLMMTNCSSLIYERFKKAKYKEQSALEYLLTLNPYFKYVKYHPAKLINCYDDVYNYCKGQLNNVYADGDFILHLPNRTTENRINRFNEILQAIDYKKKVSLMEEALKTKRAFTPEQLKLYFAGNGLDIGCGKSPIFDNCSTFDKADGDANRIDEILVGKAYDWIFSSHCLEHLIDVQDVLVRWTKLLNTNGYLIVTVPDEDLYEQGVFPSRFNRDHKHTFTMKKTKSWSPVSINLLDLVKTIPNTKLITMELQDIGYNRNILNKDQTTGNAMAQILFILQKI